MTEQLLEKDWQSRVIDLAKVLGYRIYHHRPAWTARGFRTALEGHAGFPDLILLKAGRLVMAELKAGTNKLQPEQQDWVRQLSEVAGIEVYVWYPRDWPAVVETLSRRP